jgi:hypothetical protein
MRKTPRILSLQPPVPFQSPDFAPPKPAHFIALLKQPRDQTDPARGIPVKHLPGPRSAILLKIVAMETYSGNTPRLIRRRQFYSRLRAP